MVIVDGDTIVHNRHAVASKLESGDGRWRTVATVGVCRFSSHRIPPPPVHSLTWCPRRSLARLSQASVGPILWFSARFLKNFFISAGRTSFQREEKRVEPEEERAARVRGAQSVFQAPLFICNAEVREGDCGAMQRTSSAGEHPTT